MNEIWSRSSTTKFSTAQKHTGTLKSSWCSKMKITSSSKMSSFVAGTKHANYCVVMIGIHFFLKKPFLARLSMTPLSRRSVYERDCWVLMRSFSATLYIDFGRSAIVLRTTWKETLSVKLLVKVRFFTRGELIQCHRLGFFMNNGFYCLAVSKVLFQLFRVLWNVMTTPILFPWYVFLVGLSFSLYVLLWCWEYLLHHLLFAASCSDEAWLRDASNGLSFFVWDLRILR